MKVMGELAKKLDESLTTFAKAYKGDQKDANKWAMIPVKEREELYKVYESLLAFNKKAAASDKEKTDYQEEKEKEKSKLGVILLVLVLLAGCCAVGVCKWQGMCCFKDEEKGVANEGGEPVKSDKKIFKKEIKSKNSHKRHAKESLVPAFKVADNEA